MSPEPPVVQTVDEEWRADRAWDAVPDLLLTAPEGQPAKHLLVVVAHPDDETLALGGLIHDAGRHGLRTSVLVASDGEASHPDSPTHSPDALARIRRRELTTALRTLNPGARCHGLGLADGRLGEHVETMTAEIAARADSSTVVVSTWRHDGHPDHEAVARAAAAAAAQRGSRHLEAPIWAWAWTTPRDFPWSIAARHHCSPEAVRRKAEAMGAYRSQTQPLSADPADAPVVPESVLEHFRRPFETILEHPAPTAERGIAAEVFDEMYAAGDDPWRHEDSWYEERKRAVALASLPGRELGRVLELGPATGLLTVDLARRGSHVVCVDVSDQALARTRRRLQREGLDERVELVAGRIPETWPAGRFDTVVVSEVAYFLTPAEWSATLRRIGATLTPAGSLVLVHWAHPLDDCPLDTDTAHDMAATETGLRTTVHHVEADFVLRVLRPAGLASIAEAEGLL